MSPARRSRRKQEWPRGLYEPRPNYYVWRAPDGRTFPIGRVPLAVARSEAMAANQHVAEQKPGLVERLSGAGNTMAALLERMPVAENKNTAKSLRSMDKIISGALGARLCAHLTVADCAQVVEAQAEAGKGRTAQAVRTRLIAVCRRGVQLGWLDFNPAEPTAKPSAPVQRGRLTLDTFRAIYDRAADVAEWLPLAMRLAIVTGADRSTIAGLQRSMVAEGHLTYRRGKTGAWIAVPLALRLDCMEWELGAVLAQRSGVVSRYLLHHVNPWGNAPAGSKVHPDRISHAFTEARKLAGIADDAAPTFHEVRSLASRLYKHQGNVDVQALLGHKTAEMTQMYQDPRGAEPVRVRIDRKEIGDGRKAQ